MARNALTVVNDAARYLEIIGVGESLSPDDVDYDCRVLNDYLSGLNARGGFYSGGTLTSASTVPLADEYLGALTKALAMHMASGFGVQLGQREIAAREADRIIINATFVTPIIQPDLMLPGSAGSGLYDSAEDSVLELE